MMYLDELLAGHSAAPADLTFTTYWKGEAQKRRLIAVPSAGLAELQRKLLKYLCERMPYPRAYRCPLENALVHRHGWQFYRLDFANAFPSIESERLAVVLASAYPELGTPERVQDFLACFCMAPGHGLAQGGPVSPFLFDLYCRAEVDAPVSALLTIGNVAYTRYVDDLMFSCVSGLLSPTLLKKIRRVVGAAGFSINGRKTTLLTQEGHDVIAITGTQILPDGGVAPSRTFLASLAQELDTYALAPGLPSERLRGMIAHFKSFDGHVRPGRRMRRLHERIARVPCLGSVRKERPRFFTQGELDDLRLAVPIERLAAQAVELKPARRGTELKGRCPFHQEKTPSFFVVPDKGFYHCFGCGAHGEVISFVMRTHSMDYVRAVRYLQNLVATNSVPY